MSHSYAASRKAKVSDMGLLVHGCQTVSRALDCFVQVAHHMTRKGKNERGHSSLRGAADIMIEISCKGHSVTVKCTKSKDSEPFTTEQYTLTPHLNSAILKSLDALNKDQISILDTVDRYPGIKPKPLIEKTKVSQATVFRILRDFKGQELVTATDGGCYTRLRTRERRDSRHYYQNPLIAKTALILTLRQTDYQKDESRSWGIRFFNRKSLAARDYQLSHTEF